MSASFANPEFIKGKWRVHPCGALLGDQMQMPDGKIVCTVCGRPAVEPSLVEIRLSRSDQRIVKFFKDNPGASTREAVAALGKAYSTISNTLVKARKLCLLPKVERYEAEE